jgi:hypothetical protein
MNFEYLNAFSDGGRAGDILADILICMYVYKRKFSVEKFIKDVWGLERNAEYSKDQFVSAAKNGLSKLREFLKEEK